jgi:hypothetical protein
MSTKKVVNEDKLIEKIRPKVLHFPGDFTLEEIQKLLENRKDILYFTRLLKDGKEFHLVKHNKDGFFKLQMLESQLLKHYEQVSSLKPLLIGIKIKGNDNFAIIENISPILMEKMKGDFNKLLTK